MNKITLFVFVFCAARYTNGQVPLGLHKYDPKIYFPEFFSYGRKLIPSSSSITEADDPVKFRRHAKIETAQRRIGKVVSYEDTEEAQKPVSTDSFLKVLHSSGDLFDKSTKAKSRGTVTFMSKHKDFGLDSETLENIKRKLDQEEEESKKSVHYVKTLVKKPNFEENSKRKSSEGKSSLPNANQKFKSQETHETNVPKFKNFQKTKINEPKPLKIQKKTHEQKVKTSQKIENEATDGEREAFKPMEKLIPEQYMRVLNTAKALNIPTGLETSNLRNANQFIIVSPKGSPDEGSLAHVRIKPKVQNGQRKVSFNFNIMRGPYDDIYHRQLYNDIKSVSAILGRSANFNILPAMNSVLSNIVLNSEWDIKKLR